LSRPFFGEQRAGRARSRQLALGSPPGNNRG